MPMLSKLSLSLNEHLLAVLSSLRELETGVAAPKLILSIPSLDSAFRDLEELAELEADWDTYGGLPPSAHATATAGRAMVAVMERFGSSVGERAAPYAVLPIADGGIQVEWRGLGREIEVSISPSGNISYLLIEPSDDGPKFQKGARTGLSAITDTIGEVVRS
jgi:hypothetical protein